MNSITIVISGHGSFATGLASSLSLLGSFPENCYAIDFTSEMSDEDLAIIFKEIVEKEKEVVFFTDLLGGTPYKEAAKIANINSMIEVVTGCNLGSLLETSYNKYPSVTELAEELVTISIMYTEQFISEPVVEVSETEDYSDGI